MSADVEDRQMLDETGVRLRIRRRRFDPLATLSFFSPLLILVFWELGARVGLIDTRFFSSPSAVLETLWKLVLSGEIVRHTGYSLSRAAAGLVLGGIPAVFIGLTMGLFPWVRAFLQPIVGAIYPIPKLALLPLILLIFGLGELSKIMIIAIGVFFPVLINTTAGVLTINPIYRDVATSHGASRWNSYVTVALPGALPMIFAGFEIALSVSLLLIVAAEFVGANDGLGYMIWNSWQTFSVERMFAGLVVISAIGFLSNIALHAFKARVIPWVKD